MRTEVETDLFQHGNHRADGVAKAIARVRLHQDSELVRAVIASIGWMGRGDWNYSLIERCCVAVGKVAAELPTRLGDRNSWRVADLSMRVIWGVS